MRRSRCNEILWALLGYRSVASKMRARINGTREPAVSFSLSAQSVILVEVSSKDMLSKHDLCSMYQITRQPVVQVQLYPCDEATVELHRAVVDQQI